MGDYGWSMDFGTSQGSVAVEYGRVLGYLLFVCLFVCLFVDFGIRE